ncbi:hypothetical protein V2G26_007225 [Clonostachys chloroleuca]
MENSLPNSCFTKNGNNEDNSGGPFYGWAEREESYLVMGFNELSSNLQKDRVDCLRYLRDRIPTTQYIYELPGNLYSCGDNSSGDDEETSLMTKFQELSSNLERSQAECIGYLSKLQSHFGEIPLTKHLPDVPWEMYNREKNIGSEDCHSTIGDVRRGRSVMKIQYLIEPTNSESLNHIQAYYNATGHMATHTLRQDISRTLGTGQAIGSNSARKTATQHAAAHTLKTTLPTVPTHIQHTSQKRLLEAVLSEYMNFQERQAKGPSRSRKRQVILMERYKGILISFREQGVKLRKIMMIMKNHFKFDAGESTYKKYFNQWQVYKNTRHS